MLSGFKQQRSEPEQMKTNSADKNIVWHSSGITPANRAERNGHKGAVVWFTGLSGSGKSTVAVEVERRLFESGAQTYILDGDNIRHGLNSDLGFSPEDRTENIRRIGEVSKLFADSGTLVLTAFISPLRRHRDSVRAELGGGQFIEVHVDADLETCKERDPKGLYAKAIAGEIDQFTGISAPYEPPKKPEIQINTSKETLDQSATKVIDHLRSTTIFTSKPDGCQ